MSDYFYLKGFKKDWQPGSSRIEKLENEDRKGEEGRQDRSYVYFDGGPLSKEITNTTTFFYTLEYLTKKQGQYKKSLCHVIYIFTSLKLNPTPIPS